MNDKLDQDQDLELGLESKEKNPLIETLEKEHQLILKILAAFEVFVDLYDKDPKEKNEDLSQFLTLFQTLGDAHHHEKEEKILFQGLKEEGFPLDQEPLEALLKDHDTERKWISELARIALKSENEVNLVDQVLVKDIAKDLTRTRRGHIRQEEEVIYPMAIKSLSSSTASAMEKAFLEFEFDANRQTQVEELKNSAKSFITKWKPSSTS